MEDEKNANEVDHYPLDEAAIEFFAIWKARRDSIQERMNGAFELYVHQHNLKGNWKLAENGKELERIPDAMPVQPGK